MSFMKIIGAVPFEAIVQAWLKSEWYSDFFNPIRTYVPQSLIDDEDFSNQQNNALRYWLLSASRFNMLEPLPAGITWYSATYDRADIDRTYVVASNNWGPITGNSYRTDVAMRNLTMIGDPAAKIRDVRASLSSIDRRLILVASDINSVLTIIEGNHRAVAMFADALDRNAQDPIIAEVFVGVSSNMLQYMWHMEQPLIRAGLLRPMPLAEKEH